jgi:hypothetical protein
MTDEPPRLKDVAPDVLRDLLREGGRVPAMTSEDRAEILSGIATAGAGVLPGPAATAAAKSTAFLAPKASVAIAVAALVGLGVVGAMWPRDEAPPASPNVAPKVIGLPSVPSDVRPTAPSPTDDAPPSEALPAASSPPAPADDSLLKVERTPTPVERPAPSTLMRTTPPTSGSGDSLGAESSLIGAARSKIDVSPGDALALLDEHARRFPRGALDAERDFLRIKVLRRLGRIGEARERARRYETNHPSSPYTPPVRTMLNELEGRP